ncbi:glycosyl hydrolases family 31-domain-containing protein [Pilobolus umbonatus]|nr:glycosyl hydrolases family 31-domain-containing protein [Pilobolus umbonatus]
MKQKIAEGFRLRDNKHPFLFENGQGQIIKIIIVSSQVVRVRYLTKEDTEVRVYNKQVNIVKQEQSVEFKTNLLKITVTVDPYFHIQWTSLISKVPFAEDLPYRSYCYNELGEKWHYQRRLKNTMYFGLGEHAGGLELSDRKFKLERLDGSGYDAETQDPMYKLCPFYIGLSTDTKAAYGVYYNTFTDSKIDFGVEKDAVWGSYSHFRSSHGPLDYYIIYGPSVPKIISYYSLITGRPKHLIPRYSLGYLASFTAEENHSQIKIENFIFQCDKYNIPCDGVHLSAGYTVDANGNRCVFNWNLARFPNPTQLARTMDKKGIKLFANVKPWLLQDIHPDYNTLKNTGGLIWDDEKGKPGDVYQWKKDDHSLGKVAYIDYSSTSGYNYWKSKVKTEIINKGFIPWLDSNEFPLANDSFSFACEVQPDAYSRLVTDKDESGGRFIYGPNIPKSRTSAHIVGTPLQTLLMIQATYDILIESRRTQRPFILSRSMTPYSNQLVSQSWSGSNITSWNTLKYNIPMGISANLGAVSANYGHNIGGFTGPKPDAELFTRWIQQAVFWPRFSIQSKNEDQSKTEPWMYPELIPTVRGSIHFRYKIVPYLYTLYVTHAYRNGEPLIRPIFYEFQDDIETYSLQYEFMLGTSLMVAPIYEPSASQRKVYLPSNSAWYHYQTGTYYETVKGQWIEVPSLLTDEACPFFVRAGSMMCFGKLLKNLSRFQEDNERRVQIFPDKYVKGKKVERKTFVMYEDDGQTMYHETGNAYAQVHIWMEAGEKEIRVGLDIIHDGYFPYYDTVWVTCPIDSEKRKVVFEGANVYDNEMVFIEGNRHDLHTYVGLKLHP